MADTSTGDDGASRAHQAASEETPLLGSEAASSRASAGASPAHANGNSNSNSNSNGNGVGPAQSESGPDHDHAKQQVSRGRGVAIGLSMFLLLFLQTSNMSGMTMAQSTIAEDLDAFEDAMWFTSSYLIALSALSPLMGRLAAIFSARAMILYASILFAIGGTTTASARSFVGFIAGRVISGMGAAGIMVLSIILVLELTNKKQRGLFIGLVNAGFTVGVSLGAIVYGAIVPVAGWRILFWLQVPAGVVAGLGVYFSIPKTFNAAQTSEAGSVASKLRSIDYLGAVLLTSTIVLFLYGLSNQIQMIPLLVSLGLLVSFVAVEFFVAKHPIVPIAVLKNRGALLSCLSQLGFMASRWTILFYAPITALAVFGFSPGAAGSMLVPTNLGFGLGGLLVGLLHVRRAGSFWVPCLVSIFFFAVTLYVMSLVSDPGTPTAAYVVVLFFNGLFTGAALNYTLAHLLHLTLPETHYVATSLLGTFRGFAGSFGSAIGGGIFSRSLRAHLEQGYRAVDGTDQLSEARQKLIRRLIGSPASVYNGGLGGVDHQVAVSGYADALTVLFQCATALALIVVVLQAATGWKGPVDRKEDVEETREAFDEHDAELEA